MAEYEWRGIDSRGTAVSGEFSMAPRHLAAVVEDRFSDGMALMVVKLDGREVARIGHNSEGERVWHAERPPAAPLAPEERWQALKDWLAKSIEADLAVAEEFAAPDVAEGLRDDYTAASKAHYCLVSANRSTLAKMRELEGGR